MYLLMSLLTCLASDLPGKVWTRRAAARTHLTYSLTYVPLCDQADQAPEEGEEGEEGEDGEDGEEGEENEKREVRCSLRLPASFPPPPLLSALSLNALTLPQLVTSLRLPVRITSPMTTRLPRRTGANAPAAPSIPSSPFTIVRGARRVPLAPSVHSPREPSP